MLHDGNDSFLLLQFVYRAWHIIDLQSIFLEECMYVVGPQYISFIWTNKHNISMCVICSKFSPGHAAHPFSSPPPPVIHCFILPSSCILLSSLFPTASPDPRQGLTVQTPVWRTFPSMEEKSKMKTSVFQTWSERHRSPRGVATTTLPPGHQFVGKLGAQRLRSVILRLINSWQEGHPTKGIWFHAPNAFDFMGPKNHSEEWWWLRKGSGKGEGQVHYAPVAQLH